MSRISSFMYEYHLSILRADLRRIHRAMARPKPDYEDACVTATLMLMNMQYLYNLLNGMRNMYDEERAQGQGPREARPTSPAEDDPA